MWFFCPKRNVLRQAMAGMKHLNGMETLNSELVNSVLELQLVNERKVDTNTFCKQQYLNKHTKMLEKSLT